MPNGRRTTMQVGQLMVNSGQIAVLDPIAFGELLGIDHDTTQEAITKLVANQEAFRWHAIGHTYRVLKHDHDEGYASYEVSP